MNKKDTFWEALKNKDNYLHVPLGAAFGGLVGVFFAFFGIWALPSSGSLYLYLREVTQEQKEFHNSNIFKGWLLKSNPWRKHFEWFIPSLILFAITGIWVWLF